VFAALWVALAVWRDGVTYHLAPAIVAAIPVLVYRGTDKTARPSTLLAASGAGTLLAIGAALVLALVERMNGPSLLPVGGALTESLVFAGVAGVTSGALSIIAAGRDAE
jgi:uncharacterized membrane protein YgdD (TMEM256/DUF423 family)